MFYLTEGQTNDLLQSRRTCSPLHYWYRWLQSNNSLYVANDKNYYPSCNKKTYVQSSDKIYLSVTIDWPYSNTQVHTDYKYQMSSW